MLSTVDQPVAAHGGIAVLKGTLAPDGAIVKTSAADPRLLRHRGPALVFDSIDELHHRIDDPDLDVTADTVLVLRNAGPVAAGMPEWGQLPIPTKLLRDGVTDMVRISDARMSGTVVLHAAPEAAAGGPLALLRTGDPIVLDCDERTLDIDVPARELDRRTAATPPRRAARGYLKLYADAVTQADRGCDFTFLTGRETTGAALPTGLLRGWQGGW